MYYLLTVLCVQDCLSLGDTSCHVQIVFCVVVGLSLGGTSCHVMLIVLWLACLWVVHLVMSC